MTMRGRVAIYMRFATREQIDGDLSVGYFSEQAYSLSEKHIYVEECAGEGVNGRPALTRLREDASRREFDVVLTYSYESLAREGAPLTDLIAELAQNGVRIESLGDRL